MFGFFLLTMLSVIVLNSANGIYQNSIFGVLSDFPKHFINSVIIGNNTCGIFVSLLLIFTLSCTFFFEACKRKIDCFNSHF